MSILQPVSHLAEPWLSHIGKRSCSSPSSNSSRCLHCVNPEHGTEESDSMPSPIPVWSGPEEYQSSTSTQCTARMQQGMPSSRMTTTWKQMTLTTIGARCQKTSTEPAQALQHSQHDFWVHYLCGFAWPCLSH